MAKSHNNNTATAIFSKKTRNTINDIAYANNIIPADQAQQRFYKDIEEQYDDKLGFELQLNKLRSEIATVNINLNVWRTALLAQPLVGPSLQRLFSKGVVEQDIVELANLLERSNDHSSGSDNSTKIDIQESLFVLTFACFKIMLILVLIFMHL